MAGRRLNSPNLTVLEESLQTDNRDNSSSQYLSADFYAIQFLCITCIMVLSVVGNFIVCMVVKKTRSLDSATGIFILSLAVSDLLRGLTVMPFVLINSARFGRWDFSQALCSICGFTNTLFLSASVLTLAAVSIDRFIAIVKPLQYVLLMTTRVARIMLVIVWSIAAIDATAPLIGWSRYKFVHQMSLCTTPWNEDLSYSFAQLVVSIILPLMILSWCYFYIFRVARRQQKQIFIAAYWVRSLDRDRSSSRVAGDSRSSSYTGGDYDLAGEIFMKVPSHTPPLPQQQVTNAPRAEKKAAYTIFFVIGVSLFCIIPKQILSTWARDDHYSHSTTCYIIATSSLISLANSAANPFVYGILNRRFRRTFIEILTCYPHCSVLQPFRRPSDPFCPYSADDQPRTDRTESTRPSLVCMSPYPSPRPSSNFFNSPMPERRPATSDLSFSPSSSTKIDITELFSTGLESIRKEQKSGRRTSLPHNTHNILMTVQDDSNAPGKKYRRMSDPAQHYDSELNMDDESKAIVHQTENVQDVPSGARIVHQLRSSTTPASRSATSFSSMRSSVTSMRRRVSTCVEEEEDSRDT